MNPGVHVCSWLYPPSLAATMAVSGVVCHGHPHIHGPSSGTCPPVISLFSLPSTSVATRTSGNAAFPDQMSVTLMVEIVVESRRDDV